MARGAGIDDFFGGSRGTLFLGRGDAVFAVAVNAKGGIDIAAEGLLTVNALLVFIKNEFVAAAAGLGLFGHEMRLPDAFNVMDAMTVRADSGELEEAFLIKGSAVNAFHVFMIGHFPVDVIFDDDMHVLVAGRTGQGNVFSVD
jgi:hypothetical protein